MAGKPKKTSSPVWEYFDLLDNAQAICLLCKEKIPRVAGSTWKMRRHIKSQHRGIDLKGEPKNQERKKKQVENTQERVSLQLSLERTSLPGTSSTKKTEKIGGGLQISAGSLTEENKSVHETPKRKYTKHTTAPLKRKSLPGTSPKNPKQKKLKKLRKETKKISQKNVDNAVLNFIVQGLQPFSLVELPAFQSFVTELQSKSTIKSQTAVRDQLANATVLMKEKVKEAMRKASYIATTTDCWSASFIGSFIGITAHWLDPSNFKRHSVALACRQLKGSPTVDVLARELNDIHSEYEICEKIVRTTTDNGSNKNNNAAAAEETTDDRENEVDFVDVHAIMAEDGGLHHQLPKHHQCACHLLNLVSSVDVSNASYNTLAKSTFAVSQDLWKKTSRSATAAEVVRTHCQVQLVQPRWNSFYMAAEQMLTIIKEQGEGALRAVCDALNLPMYSPVEIAFLGEYVNTMAPVMKALEMLQGESKTLLGWLLPTITILIFKLETLRPSLIFCTPLVDALLDGVNKRFGEMMSDPELIAAAILHPKFKSSWTTDEVLQRGLRYIKEQLQQQNNSSSISDEDYFSSMKQLHSTKQLDKQLDTYLKNEAEDIEILTSYPDVAKLSLKLNTALPASAACERLFGAAGLLFSPGWGRIHSQDFENQLLLKLNKDFYKFQ